MADFNKEFMIKFGADFEQLQRELSKVEKAVKDALANIDKQVEKSTDKISDSVEDTAKDVKKITSNMEKEATKSYDKMADSFEDATDEMAKSAESATKKVNKNLSDMANSKFDNLNKNFSSTANEIKSLANTVASDVTTSLGKISNVSVGSGLDSTFENNIGGIKGAAEGVANSVSKSLDKISNVNVGSGIDSKFNTSVSGMASTAKDTVDKIQNEFAKTDDNARTWFSKISSALKTATGDMPSVASGLATSVSGKLRDISAKAKSNFTMIKDYFKNGTDTIESNAEKVSVGTSSSFNKMSSKVSSAFEGLSSEAKSALSKMTSEGKQEAEKLASAYKSSLEGLSGLDRKLKSNSAMLDIADKIKELSVKFNVDDSELQALIRNLDKFDDKTIEMLLKLDNSKAKSELEEVGDKADDVAKEMKNSFDGAGKGIGDVLSGLKGKFVAIAGAVAGAFGIRAISGFIDEAKDLNKELGKVLFSMQQMGMSKGGSSKAYSSVFSVIGDEGRAGETIQNLTRVAQSEEELMKMAELVTDAHLTLGESLTPESFAESIALSVQLGEIDGNLDDVIRDCGYTTEGFNEILANCTTEQERLNVITDMLSKNYGGATDSYKNANKEMVALNESIAQNQIAQMNLGETLAPLKSQLLDKVLTPLYKWLAEKLPPLMDKFNGWINGVDWGLVGQQLGTIWENLSKFLGGVWDGLSESLSPIAGFISSIWNSINGEVNTENMDSVNESLVKIKPMFEWFAEHGEDVGNGIGDVVKALLTWKGITLGIKVGKTLKAIKDAGGMVKWLGEYLGLSVAAGPGAVIEALAIPFVISLTFEYWGTEEQKDAVEERVNDRMGIQTGKNRHGKDKGKQLNNGNHFDWGEAKEAWDNFWTGLSETHKVNTNAINENQTIFGNNMANNFAIEQENANNHKLNLGNTWEGIKNGWSKLWSDNNDTQEKQGSILELRWSGIWEKIKNGWWNFDSNFMEFQKTFNGKMSNLGDSIRNWGKGLGDFFSGFWNGLLDWFSNIPNAVAEWFNQVGIKIETELNSIIGGINSFFELLGLDKHIGPVNLGIGSKSKTPTRKPIGGNLDAYASGTDNARGGLSLVGEAGREIVNNGGNMFMANKPMLVNLKAGAQVLSNPVTEALLKTGIPRFAKGKDEQGLLDKLFEKGSSIWEYMGKPIAIVNRLLSGLKGDDIFSSAVFQYIINLKDDLVDWVKEQFEKAMPSGFGAFDGIEKYITSKFGARWGTIHKGIDLAGGIFGAGMPVYSQSSGKVLTSGYSDTAGYWNVIQTGELLYKYMHMMAGSLTKAVGDMVKAGDVLGKVGNTGNSYGAHLHFQVERNGVAIDPTSYFTGVGYGTGSTKASAWRNQILQAAAFFGEKLSENEIARIIQQINTESGGNAGLTQRYDPNDINCRNGNPAKGLLQYIPSTFAAYAVKGHTNIWNGFDQLLAFFNNSQWRKNLPQLGERRGWTPRGKRRMANGGIVNSPTTALIGEAGYSEAVVPLNAQKVKPFGEALAGSLIDELSGKESSDSKQAIVVNVPVYLDGKQIATQTAPYTKEELDKLDRRKNRLHGVK